VVAIVLQFKKNKILKKVIMSSLLKNILYVLPTTSTIVLLIGKRKLSNSQKKFLKIILLTSSLIVIIRNKKYFVTTIKFAFYKIKSLMGRSKNLKSNVQDLNIASSDRRVWFVPVIGIGLVLLGIYGKRLHEDYLLHQYINDLLEQLANQETPAAAYPSQGF
jgi:hypothetical protein